MAKDKYDVLSPDGFSISRDSKWRSKAAVKNSIKVWCQRFETQGYYSSTQGRISLDDLPKRVKVIDLKTNKEISLKNNKQ